MMEIKIPLSVARDKRNEYHRNYRRLTNNSGRLFLIAGDQKVEHLNDDFVGAGISPQDNGPEHLFQIAAACHGSVLAAHLGLISRYGQNYRTIPYIVKLNGKTNIGPAEEKDSSRLWWTVEDIIKFKKQSSLNIVGIGYTLYLGGRYEAKMLAVAAQAIFQAHQAGLTAILWVYPRGKNIKEEDIHTIAGGAGVAAALDADFVKLKYPYGGKDRKSVAEKFKEVVVAAGRTKVICVGGAKRPTKEQLTHLEDQIKIAGTSGLAIGRNLHQRHLKEATAFGAALGKIIFYSGTNKPAAKIGKFLGLF